jgi:bifunctional UDP-N-acetylglucosamine pyrophosphorylase / glucosamine-1-phosphate N-acetyltransferase
MSKRLVVLILAAGEGTRFRSETTKILHPLLGKSLLLRTIEAARGLAPRRILLMAGRDPDRVAAAAREAGVEVFVPKDRRGTARAVAAAKSALAGEEASDLLILPADRPLVRTETLRELLTYHRRRRAVLTVMSAEVPDPRGCGRVVRGEGGAIRIVGDGEAGPAALTIREIETSIYAARVGGFLSALSRSGNRKADGGIDPAAAAGRLSRAGLRVEAFMTPASGEILRVETRFDLARAAAALRDRINRAFMDAGVTIVDPATAWIDEQARLAPDAVIAPFVVIEGASTIGRRTKIGPGCQIIRCAVGDDVVVAAHTVMEDAVVESGVRVGPFARLRARTVLRRGAHVGNFVEMKATDFGPGAKAGHLSYLGDSEVGADANIGAGTITCNFDGLRKNRTTIGPGAFIGSGSQLVAPVAVGRGAYVAAGSVITMDVSPDALAVARGRQCEKPDWAKRRREKIEQGKKVEFEKR